MQKRGKQHGHKKSGYRDMQPFQSMDNVGDYYMDPTTGKAMYYADWDVTDIMYQNWAPSQSHNVNIQGTSGRTTYYLSFGYDKKEGGYLNFNPDQVRRYNVNANITTYLTTGCKWVDVSVSQTETIPNPIPEEALINISGAGVASLSRLEQSKVRT